MSRNFDPGSSTPFLDTLLWVLTHLDALAAVFCLSLMVLLVLGQIVLRNLNISGMPGIPGADELVRHLVLWVVFLGAGMATRKNRHIHIDLLPRFLPKALKRPAEVAVAVFSITVLSILCYASFQFVRMEMDGGFDPPIVGIPVWIFQTIIPLGYALIALTFAVHAIGRLFERKGS